MCPECKSLQNATKRLSVHKAPNILIVTIKRHDVFGRKISRSLQYPSAFDLKKYTDGFIDGKTSGSHDEKVIYDLYGVVIHSGASTNSGHYYAYCKGVTNGNWYECNDSYVGGISS
jgi:ubiquitin carboxyl-terminal hydrolase 36/42